MGFGQVTLLVYAILMLVGGFIGYAKAGSMVSLIAGSVSGVLLLITFAVSRSRPTVGLWIGAVLALLLAGNFAQRLSATGKFMPSGAMMVVSAVVLVVLIVAALKSRGR